MLFVVLAVIVIVFCTNIEAIKRMV